MVNDYIMKVSELLKKHNLNIELSKQLLNKTIQGDYKTVKKTKLILDNNMHLKEEHDCYLFTGDDCQCIIAPTNSYQTVSYNVKKENYAIGCSYDNEGNVTSIA